MRANSPNVQMARRCKQRHLGASEPPPALARAFSHLDAREIPASRICQHLCATPAPSASRYLLKMPVVVGKAVICRRACRLSLRKGARPRLGGICLTSICLTLLLRLSLLHKAHWRRAKCSAGGVRGVEEPLGGSFQHRGLARSHRAMQAVMDAASTDPRAVVFFALLPSLIAARSWGWGCCACRRREKLTGASGCTAE